MSACWIILGASSAMARAFARDAAARGATLVLAGRDLDDVTRSAQDARIRGAQATHVMRFDARDPDSFTPILEFADSFEGTVNLAIFAGSMPAQEDIDTDPALFDGVVSDNFSGTGRFLLAIAPILEARRNGTIVALGSVAGDRGRIKNYAYGAAKAGFHTLLSGLRNRLGRADVHVMTVKPGFVDTAITWGLEGMFLVSSPEDVSAHIWKGIEARRNVLYTPWFWIIIMTIIRTIPERLFKKLSI